MVVILWSEKIAINTTKKHGLTLRQTFRSWRTLSIDISLRSKIGTVVEKFLIFNLLVLWSYAFKDKKG